MAKRLEQLARLSRPPWRDRRLLAPIRRNAPHRRGGASDPEPPAAQRDAARGAVISRTVTVGNVTTRGEIGASVLGPVMSLEYLGAVRDLIAAD